MAFLRDPSTCLMEAPEVWGEREVKHGARIGGEIELTLVKYTGNPQMPSSDGGGLVGRSVMSVLGPN